MNGFSNTDETYAQYSLAPTDDLIRFWSSKVKGRGHGRPSSWRRHVRRRRDVEVHLLYCKFPRPCQRTAV